MATTEESTVMETFVGNNLHLAEMGQARDKAARVLISNLVYDTYDQGSLKAIMLRAKAPDASISASSCKPRTPLRRGSKYCNTCDGDVGNFALHNQTSVFYNMAGRGGDSLENTTKPWILSLLNRTTALYVLAEDRLKAEAILEEKARLLNKLQQHNMPVVLHALEREFPSDLISESADFDEESMEKAEVVALIVKLREEMKKWYSIFTDAEFFLGWGMKGDDVEDHQDMQDDLTEYPSSDVESDQE